MSATTRLSVATVQVDEARASCAVSGRRERRVTDPLPTVVLACTACQLVYQPDLSAFESGRTGCPRCGGWTWIAQLGADEAGGGQSCR